MWFKKQNEIIEISAKEVHEQFDLAYQKMLEKCNVTTETKISLRLKKIGFVNSKLGSKADEILNKKTEHSIAKYYKKKYPALKFVTEQDFKDICKKYNLVYSLVNKYIGDVPVENLIEIENCPELDKIDEPNDEFRIYYNMEIKKNTGTDIKKQYICLNKYANNSIIKLEDGKTEFDIAQVNNILSSILKSHNIPMVIRYSGFTSGCNIKKINKSGLYIAAPEEEFTGLDKLFKTEFGYFEQTNGIQKIIKKKYTPIHVKDPIVFRYVRDGIQIITKWGL